MEEAAAKGDVPALRALVKAKKGPSAAALAAALENGKYEAGLFLALAAQGTTAIAKDAADSLLEKLAANPEAVEACCVLVDVLGASGAPALVAAAGKHNFDLCRALLERGFDANAADAEGNTVLHHAAQAGNLEFVKSAVLYGAKDCANKKGELAAALVPADQKQVAREIGKPVPAGDKAAAVAAKFKEMGNKVFADKEFVKAIKLYTVAIAHLPGNHVLYSNRAACFYNQGKYDKAFSDASRCVALDGKWAKGYFRKGACLACLNLPHEALQVYDLGLKVDSKQGDLVKARAQLSKDIKALEKKSG